MKNILLIGGAGYVGSVITDFLLRNGYKVTCFDGFLYDNQRTVLPYILNENYKFICGDLCDEDAVKQALFGIDSVVLLAGLVGDPITKKYPDLSKKINDDGIMNLFQIMNGKGIERLIFISTCSNYGLIQNDELADENFELSPLSLYAKAKVAAEKELLSEKNNFDFSTVVLRFATAFGLSPRMRFDLTVSEFTKDLILGKELLVYDAQTWRPYCHVKDFARLIDIVLKSPKEKTHKEVFNAGGEINNFTKQGILDIILKYLPNSKVSFKEHGSDPRNYKVNFSKVKSVLGFEPKYTVEDGVKELIEAFQLNLFKNLEQDINFHGNYTINYP
ncbi:NAD(P)-dependent oxidoreductase [Leptospira bandrabouensis]|uniref:NAD-dependent epimerase/dehydratase family protein n=1 Tax=Leptospira bandrabouensis TaxID=2484903 RepID=UPI001EE984C3|nr:NAD(P)-dependent oxidoreductase [Leptospira bandrabouensis]MCG6144956.1 NAD(P)-dependent oxidoreductase [Leptospira bandrabouensis]MCG6160407.1 NAD(P)-dependent oxidoreductase [Leptospira bandrabouensis]MCG6164339.1 NAD(P)-dependent oxidoreductase [Leptospira bandrabouensis]MCW7460311.1 NAD(P)-dependent oxidoreductase [Leptospira bandrabouensis]MCW7478198.1 NAD(P)-dependent oxidoreductase [Leptospira bandrabouensis]